MKEPTIDIGFIIFNEDWKEELVWKNGHRKTAFEWIKKHNFMELYNSIKGQNGIYDEEDFLVEYIGAVKLYAYRGNLYCSIPRMCDPNKSYLKHFFEAKGYQIVEAHSYEEKQKQKVLTYEYPYNKTIINSQNGMMYNPYRDGD